MKQEKPEMGKRKRNTKEPVKLKVGDNVLVRDHTSKAFQPKYKDFCIVGLLGKNQIEIKDNHGYTTKVHRRDIKKIPMTEKVCQLYEEEQLGKVREGRKAVPKSKMPDLAWDIAEAQLQTRSKPDEAQELPEPDTPLIPVPLQAMIAIGNTNNNNTMTHQDIHTRNPRINRKSNTSGKIYNHKNQP